MSSPLFETVRTVFSEENWAFEDVPGREVLEAGFEAHHSRVELHVQVFPERSVVSVVSESSVPSGADPARRERVAELLMRVNQWLTVGNFELDWDTGRVRFRTTNIFSDETGDPEIIRGMVGNTIVETDCLTPLLAAIARAEGSELAGLDVAELIRRSQTAATVPESNP